ncbi:hypothetical protein IV83_GL000237 [Pediococcus inopinatus]|nr:hypothetical protein IV83_GL000237 [Pediococcus inopinatus]
MISLVERLTGVVALLLAIWQFYSVYRTFRHLKQHGGKETSSFILVSLWSAAFFGLIMVFIGFMLMLKQF